jgi:hypothetical protein
LPKRAIEILLGILDTDRRTNQDRGKYERDWPVMLSVPLTPMEYDALRFLSSLYPANPGEIMRASVLRALDPGAPSPSGDADGKDMERTARVELGLDDDEMERLGRLAARIGSTPEETARWAMLDALGVLMDVPRGR